MSSYLAPINQDPPFLFIKPVQKPVPTADKSLKLVDLEIKVAEQLKPKIGFDILSLVESGQLTLLQISEKFGVLFLAFGSELIVVNNFELNQVLTDGTLPIDKIMANGKNATNSNPISFLKVSDKADCLFLQHAGDDFLLIANLRDVISDPKQGLVEAKRVKMDLSSPDVRQVSVSPGQQSLATVVSRNPQNEHKLLLVNYDSAAVTHRKNQVTSAVFTEDGQHIVAGKDDKDEHLLILDLTLAQKNAIKLSFPNLHDDIQVDVYRVLWVCEPYKNNSVIFVAYFGEEDDLEANIGRTMMIWIGDDLAKPGLSLDALKQADKVKALFWDYDHFNDDIIPSFNLEWFENPNSNQMIGIAMMNHQDQPYLFNVTDGNLKEGYEMTKVSQLINRPFEPGTDDVMEPGETLGACLGFQILRTKMKGAEDILQMTLIPDEGEEDIPYPQTMLFYSLNGVINQYQLFLRDWRKDNLLKKPQPLPQKTSLAKAPQPAQMAAQQAAQQKDSSFSGGNMAPIKPSSSKSGLFGDIQKPSDLAAKPQTNPLFGANMMGKAPPLNFQQVPAINQNKEPSGWQMPNNIPPQQNQMLSQPPGNMMMEQQPKMPMQKMMQAQPQQTMHQPAFKEAPVPVAPPKPKTKEQIGQEMFARFSHEMKLALIHESNFANLFNQTVIANMNKVSRRFPNKDKLLDEMEMHQKGFINMLASAAGDQKTRQEMKESLEETHRSFLAMHTQQKLCNRLKREAKYGIAGDMSVSVASPCSDLMKLNKTYKEFISGADYDEADKEILFEIFEKGDLAIHSFDRLVKHLEMQETLKALYQKRLALLLGEDAARRRTEQASQAFASPFSAPSTANMSAEDKFRMQLELNAGIRSRETDQSQISAQAYTVETTKHLRDQISSLEKEYDLVKAIINRKDIPTSLGDQSVQTSTLKKSTKFGDEDGTDSGPDASTKDGFKLTENELKHEEEVQQKKDLYRKMVRDKKRQKEMQRKLLAQATQPKVCQLELSHAKDARPSPLQAKAGIPNPTVMQAMKQFQQSGAQLSNAANNKGSQINQVEKEKQKIASFLNIDERKREQTERSQFIAALDQELITSPNESPKPKNALGKFVEQQSIVGPDAKQSLFANGANPKPVMSMMPGGKSDLVNRQDSNAAKTQNSLTVRSFGSKTSDALQTQLSSKIAQQVSFGDEPKPLTSIQMHNLSLDQIVENDSPTTVPAKKQAESSKNLIQTPPKSGPKPLTKQPTLMNLNINIAVPKKEDNKSASPKPQKSVAFDQKPPEVSNIFGGISIGKQLVESKAPEPKISELKAPEKPKEDAKSTSFFGNAGAGKNLFGAPKDETKPEDGKKLEPPKTTSSLFGASGSLAQPKKDEQEKPKAAPSASIFGASAKPDAPKTTGDTSNPAPAPTTSLFGAQANKQDASGISSEAKPSTLIFGSSSSGGGTPAFGFGQAPKPKEDANAQPGSQPQAPGQPKPLAWGGFQSGATGAQPLGGSGSVFGAAQASNQPKVFGQVDIGAQKPAEAPKQVFGGGTFGGASTGEVKPMSFSSASGQGAGGGGLLKFGNPAPQAPAQGGIFGQNQAQPQGFAGFGAGGNQPAMQQPAMQPLSFGNVQGAAQPQPFSGFGGGGQPAFTGFGGGGPQPPQNISAAMMKPRK